MYNETLNKRYHNITDMKLNSNSDNDINFSKRIKFVVEKYIGDDIPQQIICKDIHSMINEAYKLFLDDELHSVGIYDSKGNYNGTNALNYFTDNEYIREQQIKIEQLEKEIQLHKDFLKRYNSSESFKKYKEENS